jgi:hypothetical protein
MYFQINSLSHRSQVIACRSHDSIPWDPRVHIRTSLDMLHFQNCHDKFLCRLLVVALICLAYCWFFLIIDIFQSLNLLNIYTQM